MAFKLADALCQSAIAKAGAGSSLAATLNQHLNECVSLVAIATVCDVVPLRDENFVLARMGLNQLPNTTSPGLKELLSVSGLTGPITAEGVGFGIGPRLNASGRVGSAETAVTLFLSRDVDEARSFAKTLDDLNTLRKQIEANIIDEAIRMVCQPLTGLASPSNLTDCGVGRWCMV